MFVTDTNILLYAADQDAEPHDVWVIGEAGNRCHGMNWVVLRVR